LVALVVAAVVLLIVYQRNKQNEQERQEQLRIQELERQDRLRKAEEQRQTEIRSHESDWGKDICESLISKEIRIDMTPEMIRLAWGQPNDIDQKELSKTGKSKERWVYGIPRRGANYVWFTDGKVSKIKTP
jgi:type II secretory pathway pseudopilin PulG